MSPKNFLYLALIFFCISLGFFLYPQNTEKYKLEEIAHLETGSLSESVEFLVAGDIMLGRFVEKLMDENGGGFPFENIKSFLFSVPFVVGNLEGPIVENHTPTPSLAYKFSFPGSTARTLKENNISIVSLANNHTLDQEKLGYEDTEKFLTEAEVEFFGHPVSVGGISVSRKKISGQGLTFIGLNATWTFDEKSFEDVIKKESLGDNFVIVLVHWGDEYKLVSNETQKYLAHLFINSGADVIFGSHPHVVEEIEIYKNKAIFYSLGNFIFDQYFSQDVKEGLVVKVSLGNERVSYELFPTISPRSQPSLMEGSVRQDFLKKIALRVDASIQKAVEDGTVELAR